MRTDNDNTSPQNNIYNQPLSPPIAQSKNHLSSYGHVPITTQQAQGQSSSRSEHEQYNFHDSIHNYNQFSQEFQQQLQLSNSVESQANRNSQNMSYQEQQQPKKDKTIHERNQFSQVMENHNHATILANQLSDGSDTKGFLGVRVTTFASPNMSQVSCVSPQKNEVPRNDSTLTLLQPTSTNSLTTSSSTLTFLQNSIQSQNTINNTLNAQRFSPLPQFTSMCTFYFWHAMC